MKQLEYIDLKYRPSKDELICEYYLEPNRISLEKACEHIAGESSIGTWTTISTMQPDIAKRLKPHVFSIDKKTRHVKIAYPSALFEAGNMPEILSSIAGNIFGMSALRNLRLQDIHFPKSIIKKFKGPRFGIQGVRKLVKVKSRPLVGTIVKPKVGLTASQHAKVAYEAWTGGCDTVKEDENLGSMKFNNFYNRFIKTIKMKEKAEKETGEKKIYMPNLTAETDEMLKRAQFVVDNGGNYVMVDILTAGWAALQTIRNHNFGVPIHAHRAMHAAFTRNPKHGISMLTIAKISRLIGVDTLHVGAIVGKMAGPAKEIQHIGEEIENKIIPPVKKAHVLEQRWHDIKPVFAVCSGGVHPGLVQKLIKYMGNNIVIQMGGGIHWNPRGTRYGAMGARQAVEASMKKIPLKKYAKTHRELKEAIDKFGILE